MSEFEEWQGNAPAEEHSENGGKREGYRSSYNREGNFNGRSSFNRGDRPQRPRFNRSERAAYSSNGVQNERGFRPAGFGSSFSSEEGGQRQGGYQQRSSYNNNGGYSNNRGG